MVEKSALASGIAAMLRDNQAKSIQEIGEASQGSD